MKIIVFEGLDKSGKHTASLAITEHLREKGFSVVHSEFHRYDTPTGKLIQDFLYGRYKVSQETIELIMSADKTAQQDWFKELEKSGVDYLILDRYYLSQEVYSEYFIDSSNKSEQEKSYYKQLYLMIRNTYRKADMTFYLDITPETSMMRKGQHGENDKYESNLSLLDNVRQKYIDIALNSNDVFLINAEQSKQDVIASIKNILK